MLENDFFKEVQSFVFNLLKNNLSPKVVYHNYNHTHEVVQAVFEIAVAENIIEEELEVLLLAAWFHDTGYIEGIENHEDKSKSIAKQFLEEKNYPEDKLLKVFSLIDATGMPQKPSNKLEEIICDADLFHLGTENYIGKSNLLRSEWEQLCDKYLTDIEWLKSTEEFLSKHSYLPTMLLVN